MTPPNTARLSPWRRPQRSVRRAVGGRAAGSQGDVTTRSKTCLRRGRTGSGMTGGRPCGCGPVCGGGGVLSSRLPSTQASHSGPGFWGPGRSSSRALHAFARRFIFNAVVGSGLRRANGSMSRARAEAPDRSCPGASRAHGRRGVGGPDRGGVRSARGGQALGRLPWLAFFFLRARRLLPRLAMAHLSLVREPPGPASLGSGRRTRISVAAGPLARSGRRGIVGGWASGSHGSGWAER